jgi:outer membrane murein-binding lipoprotein Lpp
MALTASQIANLKIVRGDAARANQLKAAEARKRNNAIKILKGEKHSSRAVTDAKAALFAAQALLAQVEALREEVSQLRTMVRAAHSKAYRNNPKLPQVIKSENPLDDLPQPTLASKPSSTEPPAGARP